MYLELPLMIQKYLFQYGFTEKDQKGYLIFVKLYVHSMLKKEVVWDCICAETVTVHSFPATLLLQPTRIHILLTYLQ